MTATTKTLRISQSVIKEMRDYLDGSACGTLTHAKVIEGRLFDGTDSMELGTYLEYILTGALPKNGKTPQPVYMKTPVNANIKAKRDPYFNLGVSDMESDYRQAHANKDKVLEFWSKMGLVIDKREDGTNLAGFHWVDGRFDMTGDVILKATKRVVFDTSYIVDGKTVYFELKKGDRICVDIKYAGQKDEDGWSHPTHGWGWVFNPDKYPLQVKYHGTQAKHYHMVSKLPFFFFLVDPKGNYFRFVHVRVTEAAIENHKIEANEIAEKIEMIESINEWEPRPEVSKCAKCPLFKDCKHAHHFPHPIVVTLEN